MSQSQVLFDDMIARSPGLIVHLRPGTVGQTHRKLSDLFHWFAIWGEVKSIDMCTLDEVHVAYFDVQDATVAHQNLTRHTGVVKCKWKSECDVVMPVPEGVRPWQIWEQLALHYGDIASMAVIGNKVKATFVDATSVLILRELQDDLLNQSNCTPGDRQVPTLKPSNRLPHYPYQKMDKAELCPQPVKAMRTNFPGPAGSAGSASALQPPPPGLFQENTLQSMKKFQDFQDFEQMKEFDKRRQQQQQQQQRQQQLMMHQPQEHVGHHANFTKEFDKQEFVPMKEMQLQPPFDFAQMDGLAKGETTDADHFKIDLEAIARGEDIRTTCMIRNIPNKYTQRNLINTIDQHCTDIFFNFLYVPVNMHNRGNVGYAFINFEDPKDIISFYHRFHGCSWAKFNSNKVCAVAYARLQGLDALIAHFRAANSPDRKAQPIFRQRGQRDMKITPQLAPQLPCTPEGLMRSQSGSRRSSGSGLSGQDGERQSFSGSGVDFEGQSFGNNFSSGDDFIGFESSLHVDFCSANLNDIWDNDESQQ